MPTLLIDNIELDLDPCERLNLIEAAQRVGVEIPHYCWHPALSVVGSCRMCLVEVGSRDPETGAIKMFPKLVPACNAPATDGTVVVTDSEKVREARARIEEGLLLDHPVDCPICDKAGECRLQDYHFQYGQPERRADVNPFTSRRRDLGDVALFVDRCIVCSRCVRFSREVSGTAELLIEGRGHGEEINVVSGFPLANKLSGNVVDLCPVGALAEKDFLYRQRVWFLRTHPGVCTGCDTGCSTWIDENQDRVWRIRPRENDLVNRWWICNDGRTDYAHVHDHNRLLGAVHCDSERLDWAAVPERLYESLVNGGRLAGVFSPFMTVEEAWMLAGLLSKLDPTATLAMGPIPRAEQDETFPGGFTISAEKCPNRRGVQQVLKHFTGKLVSFEAFLDTLDPNPPEAVWIAGGYKTDWIDQPTAERFDVVPLRIVQDLFPSPLSARATYRLAGGTFAERSGSYVNRGDHLQAVQWAVRPPADTRTEGSLLWQIGGRKGLYRAEEVREELARAISYFGLAGDEIPPGGVQLKWNQIAGTRR